MQWSKAAIFKFPLKKPDLSSGIYLHLFLGAECSTQGNTFEIPLLIWFHSNYFGGDAPQVL